MYVCPVIIKSNIVHIKSISKGQWGNWTKKIPQAIKLEKAKLVKLPGIISVNVSVYGQNNSHTESTNSHNVYICRMVYVSTYIFLSLSLLPGSIYDCPQAYMDGIPKTWKMSEPNGGEERPTVIRWHMSYYLFLIHLILLLALATIVENLYYQGRTLNYHDVVHCIQLNGRRCLA